MAELNFPPGYLIRDYNEYQIIRRQPISDGINNTFSEVYLVKKVKIRKKFVFKVLKPEIIAKYKRTVEDFNRTGPLSYASDLYSAGKTFYTMLTGKLPGVNKPVKELPDNLKQKNWYDDVLQILKKATEHRPQARSTTALEMKDGIKTVFQKKCRKNKVIIDIKSRKKYVTLLWVAAVLLIVIGTALVREKFSGYSVQPDDTPEFLISRDRRVEIFTSTEFSDPEVESYSDTLSENYPKGDAQCHFFAATLAELTRNKKKSIRLLGKAVTIYADDTGLKIALGKAYFSS